MPKLSSSKKKFTAADLRDVSDNPEWTKGDFAKAKPFHQVFPDLAGTIRRRGKKKAPVKEPGADAI